MRVLKDIHERYGADGFKLDFSFLAGCEFAHEMSSAWAVHEARKQVGEDAFYVEDAHHNFLAARHLDQVRRSTR